MHTNYFIILLPGYEDVQFLLENGKLLQNKERDGGGAHFTKNVMQTFYKYASSRRIEEYLQQVIIGRRHGKIRLLLCSRHGLNNLVGSLPLPPDLLFDGPDGVLSSAQQTGQGRRV